MEPGRLAAAAPRNVLGEEGLFPEFWSFPEGEAYRVQSLEQGLRLADLAKYLTI